MNPPTESKHEVGSVEEGIQTAKDRLESLQAANNGASACEENARAISYLTKALRQCDMRTQRLKAEAKEAAHAE